MRLFTAREVSRLAGFEKPWMLNHLEREQIFIRDRVDGPHHGKHRGYTFRDIVVLRAINRLLKLGARPKRIKEAIATFTELHLPRDKDGDDLMSFARSSYLFILTSEKVIFCESPDELVDLAKRGQLAFSFMLDGREIAPSIDAGVSYLDRIKEGALRDDLLLQDTAAQHGL